MSRNVNSDTFVGPSFGLGNRTLRFIWNVFYLLFFRFSPRPFHAWRRSLLRLFGAKMESGVHVYPSARIWAPWLLECRAEAGIGDRAIIYNQARIIIGRRAVISQGAHLCAGTHDYDRPGMPLVALPITVGEKAWIAAECFLLPGVEIGDGTVVGARSVVTKSMPAWHVCAGHPCSPIKKRTKHDGM